MTTKSTKTALRTTSIIAQGTDYVGDMIVRFTNAYGNAVTTFIRRPKFKESSPGKKLVLCKVLSRFKRMSHVRLANGEHFHVRNEDLEEVSM